MNAPLPEAIRKALESASLDDKYRLASGRAFMSGVQALVRLPMLQRQREIAIRQSLGAGPGGLLGLALAEAGLQAPIAVGAGSNSSALASSSRISSSSATSTASSSWNRRREPRRTACTRRSPVQRETGPCAAARGPVPR